MFERRLKILMLSQTDRWRCSLEYFGVVATIESPIEFIFVSEIEKCVQMIASVQPAVVLLECADSNVEQICKTVALHYHRFGSPLIAAVGEPGVESWVPLLQASGISETCFDMIQFSRFAERIKRHLTFARKQRTVFLTELSLEDFIKDQLPWRPIASDAVIDE